MNHQKDRTKLRNLQERILSRKGLIGCGTEFSAALHHSGRPTYVGTDRWGQEEARSWTEIVYLICGRDYMAAQASDGTVRIAGAATVDPDFVRMLACVRAISCGGGHLAALLGNGRAVVGGDNSHGQCHTEEWPSVIDVVCGRDFTAGLTADGRVVITGGSRPLRYAVRAWQGVAGIFTDFDGHYLYGIDRDGRLLSPLPLPREVAGWKNLLYVAVQGRRIWAVTGTGQMLSTDPSVARLNAAKYYIACAVSDTHAVALTRDGLVLSVGENNFGQCATARFGELFAYFDEFSSDRDEKRKKMEEADRAYQVRLAEAQSYRCRIACGERLTACLAADGHLLTSAGFAACKEWTQVRTMAAGSAHVVALHEDGHVSADGNDVDGCTHVSDWTNVKAVAAGKYHTLGVTEGGRVLFCGRNDAGQGNVWGWTGMRHIYAADTYTVGIGYEGGIRIAGTPPFDPALITDEWKGAVDIVVTPTHMAALYANGRVLSTLSAEDEGEVSPTDRWYNVRAIAAGRGFTVGLCYGGRVLAAGDHTYGQCDVDSWKHIVQILCGHTFTLGLTADGRVLAAGRQRLSGKADRDAGVPPATEQWHDVLALQCGVEHAVALTRSGSILACGPDEDKQCSVPRHFTLFRDARQLYGHGQYSRQIELEIHASRAATEQRKTEETPAPEAYADRAEAAYVLRDSLAVGMAHTLQLDAMGNIKVEGANDCGQCDLVAYTAALQVAAGPYRSAAVLADGSLVLAGRNTDGQSEARILNRELMVSGTLAEEARGRESSTDRAFGWRRVSCGHNHTAALRSDGRVFAIGANGDGRCDTHKWREITELACGVRHTVAVTADGRCVATGQNRYGQCNVSDWLSVATVAAGEFHTVALCTDGRVLATGDNRKGQCDVEDLTDVVFVACLPEATLCVHADGRVTVRGGSGELTAAIEALEDVVALATCEHRVAALTSDRRMILIP